MRSIAAAIALILAPLAAHAADPAPAPAATPAPHKKLIVATKPVPPFVIKQSDGSWTGVSIELWQKVADELNLEYELKEDTLQGILDGVTAGTYDVGVAAITVTAEREAAFDFTHSFYSTGLGIAVVPQSRAGWLGVAERVISYDFLKVVATLSGLLFVVGFLIWIAEHRRNPQQFGGGTVEGLGHSFWFAAVTMTTVGYGDKAPITLAGRMLALVWMFAAIITTSAFTATIASALTVGQLESKVRGPEDLPSVHVGVVAGTTGETYANRNGLAFEPYKDVDSGIDAVASGKLDAFIYDQAVMQWIILRRGASKVDVLPHTFDRQDYAIALPTGSTLREPINRALVRAVRDPSFEQMTERYLGRHSQN